jgi:predicted nucleic acid-binding protein
LRTFVDTNVLVYAVDEDEPVRHDRARELLDEVDPGTLVVSAQVLGEFYVTATRKLTRPLTAADAARRVAQFATLTVVPLDTRLVATAIDLSTTAQISYWDALILAAAASAGCERVLTEDLQDGQTIAGVRIENPFLG